MSRIQAAFSALGRDLLESEKPAVAAFEAKYAVRKDEHETSRPEKPTQPTGVSYNQFKGFNWMSSTSESVIVASARLLTAPKDECPLAGLGIGRKEVPLLPQWKPFGCEFEVGTPRSMKRRA